MYWLDFLLGSVIQDITKLVSLAQDTDTDWETSDSKAISTHGMDGLYDVLCRWGLREEAAKHSIQPSERERAGRLLESLDKIKTMLELSPGRGEVRTLLCAELLEIRFDHPLVEEIRSLTEEVNMNEISWYEYLGLIGPLLRHLEGEIKEQFPDLGSLYKSATDYDTVEWGS